MDAEIWKSIDGYDGKYQVSNLGRVKSVFTTYVTNNGLRKKYRDVILKPMVQKNGYLYVCLWSENKKKNCLIHRLVAQAFVPNPYQHPEVNHKDEDKNNNSAVNLEWCEHIYNMNYGTVEKKISTANTGRIPWSKGKKCPQLSLVQLGKKHPHKGRRKKTKNDNK